MSQPFDVGVIDVHDDGINHDLAVDSSEFFGCGLGLGEMGGYVIFVKQYLALKVVDLHEIAIADTEFADAGSDKNVCLYGSDRPTANENGSALP